MPLLFEKKRKLIYSIKPFAAASKQKKKKKKKDSLHHKNAM